MPLFIGQPIDARELEQATSTWSPEHFVSMCDALVWAVSGRACPGLPSLTERIYAGDDGIDAEWTLDLPDDDRSLPTPIIGPGWNVFQYKKRDLIAQDRRRIFSNLKSSLRGAVAEVAERNDGRHPDHYSVFANIDLKHDQTATLKAAVLEGYSRASEVRVEVVGAAELAAFLNDHPHLRAAYFSPLAFKTWEEADRAHRSHKLFGSNVDLIGREEEVKRLRSLADDPHVRAIVLSGPHDIGKSRLALEGTRHLPHQVVLALDPRSMGLSDYRSLPASHGVVTCIIEDPEPEAIEGLLNEVLTLPDLRLIVTVPTSSDAPPPSYGRDEHVQYIHLQPLQDADARELLKATGKPLDFEIEDWIIGHAGGVPGILLAAANVGAGLRRETGDFVEAVGREFERRVKSELGHGALKSVRLFSVLTHVGIEGDFESELAYLCDIFGDGLTPHAALSSLEHLERAGLARRGGSFAEVAIPMVANHLVAGLLRGRRTEMFALFGKLDNLGRLRFLRRLREVRGEEVEAFWDELFGPDGPLGDLKSMLEQGHEHMLNLVAGIVPDRTLRLLESGLLETFYEERLAITGEQRRELMWAIEQLLFRSKTSRRALWLLWLLAEAENETYGKNATGVLAECFHPRHPQMLLPLDERIEVLRDLTSDRASKRGKLVAILGVGNALRRPRSFTVRHSTGVEPLDTRLSCTYGDPYDYARDLVDLLMSLAEADDEDVAAAALKELPRLTAELGIQGRPNDAFARLQTLIGWTRGGKRGLDVPALSDAIHLMRDAFSVRADREDCPSDRREELQKRIAELDCLKDELDKGDFTVRLKRWAGRRTFEEAKNRTAEGKRGYRYELELEHLAEEAVENPSLLNTEMIEWLLSPAAQRSNAFFFQLGHRDAKGICRCLIENLGRESNGSDVFAAYFGGWTRRDREAVEARLEELAASDGVIGTAVVRATAWNGPSQTAIDRVKSQIYNGRVDPDFVETVLAVGHWIDGLNPDQLEDLLRAIAGEAFEHAPAAIDMLSMWEHMERPLEGRLADFAWRCLESDPPVSAPADAGDFDQLAARLAQDDPDRGFKLLEMLLQRDDDPIRWDPIALGGGHQFWDVLHDADRKRLLGLILNLCRARAITEFYLTWNMRDILNQEADRDVLLFYAKNDIELARIVAASITGAKPGFWPLFSELVQAYPNDERLLSNLAGGIEQNGTLITGPMSQFYEERGLEVERLLQDPSIPSVVRSRLREIADRLQGEIDRQVVWDYDEDVNDLRRHIQQKDSPERIWAIGRVLKYAEWEDLRKLLTIEDIEEVLPQTDLPPKKRRALERALEVWHNGD